MLKKYQIYLRLICVIGNIVPWKRNRQDDILKSSLSNDSYLYYLSYGLWICTEAKLVL